LLGSIAAGAVGGFLGLGGGIVLVPFLTLLIGMEMHQAVALSLSAIMANSIVSSNEYLKKDFVEFKLVIPLAIFASLGAVGGSNISQYIPEGYLKVVFSVFLLYTIYSLLRKKGAALESTTADREPSLPLVCLIAFLAGIVSSLTGVGGGILLIPAVYLVLNYSIHIARGSSAFTVGIIATAGSIVYLISGVLNGEFVGVTMLGMMGGAWIGGRTGVKAKSIVVRFVFAIALFYLAARMFYEGVS
jgi:uncharacterized membrane protein YfcA